MTDIVERLRIMSPQLDPLQCEALEQAADEIERLRTALAQRSSAVDAESDEPYFKIAQQMEQWAQDFSTDEDHDVFLRWAQAVRRLRTALQVIVDGYDNQDVNHLDYRVKTYEIALRALSSAEREGTE